MTNPSVAVGRALAQARRGAGLTQAELAARLEVSQSYVALLETGRTNPTLRQLTRVAAELGVEVAITSPDGLDQRSRVSVQPEGGGRVGGRGG